MIKRSKEWWLTLANSEGDSEVGAGMLCEREIDEVVYNAQRGFSPEAWAAGEKFVIDYYYKPGVVSTFKQALEQSPNEVTDYIELASKVAAGLDAKEKEVETRLTKALVKARGWNPDCATWTWERILGHIGYATELKYTQADLRRESMDQQRRWQDLHKGVKAELERQQKNYGKLSAKYAALKNAFRSLRKSIEEK